MMKSAMLLVVACASLEISRVWAGESLWIPGGEEVKKLVETRKGKTELSKLATSMKPGTWAVLKTEIPKGLWKSPHVPDLTGKTRGAGGLSISGWTDDAHWDSRTGQFLYMGIRQTRQFVAYSETNNAWRIVELDRNMGEDRNTNNPVFMTNTGHIYGSNAFDHERSHFYHHSRTYRDKVKGTDVKGGTSYFDVITEKWTKVPGAPGGTIEYFNAMDGLLGLGTEVGMFSTAQQKPVNIGKAPIPIGGHCMFRHNPFRQEVLMTGGDAGPRLVARLKKDSTMERLKDTPVSLRVRHGKLTVDPLSGRYLILGGQDDGPASFLEFDSDKNEYRQLEYKSPFGGYSMPVCAFVPEYGVIMWAEGGQNVHLYKHDASADHPIAVAAPLPAPKRATPGKGGEPAKDEVDE